MEKRKAPFKVLEAESSDTILTSSAPSQDDAMALVAIVEADQTQDQTPQAPVAQNVPAAPQATIAVNSPQTTENPPSARRFLTRHNAAIGGCIAVAALWFGISLADPTSLVQREAALTRPGTLTYEKPKPRLPTELAYVFNAEASDGLLKVSNDSFKDRQLGFVDETGKIAVEPRYHALGSFHEGLARASSSKSQGYIDKSGRFVIDQKFNQARDFKDGIAVVDTPNGWAMIDRQGKYVSDFFQIEPYRTGDVSIVKKDGKFGLLSNSGHYLLATGYDKIELLDGQEHFPSNAGVQYSTIKFEQPAEYFQIYSAGLVGLADRTGKVVLEPKHKAIESYANGFLVTSDEGDYLLLDANGNALAQYPLMTNWDKLIAARDDGKWIFLDGKGRKLPLPPVDAVCLSPNNKWFSNGLAPVRLNGKWGFVNRKGQFAIAPQFEFVVGFENGVCPVWNGSVWKLIDKSGHYLPLPDLGWIQHRADGSTHVDVAGPLYAIAKSEFIWSKRSAISSLNSQISAGLTLSNVWQTMQNITADNNNWNEYVGDY